MKRVIFSTLALILFIVCGVRPGFSADVMDFTVHRMGDSGTGNTVLVIGGIQGDEPGGFNAASLLVTHYRITSGSVWVVPNLNFLSIIKRSRGVYGDLNRKFAGLRESDPEFETIRKIKALIASPEVDLVLNLHDGSGFYRAEYEDNLHNSNRWGQCVIIDQEKLGAEKFGNLQSMARKAVGDINCNLIDPVDYYSLNNTHTSKGNREMEKTLTYYAIGKGKPAFGIEATKSYGTARRAYYHLQAVESFLSQAKIGFERRLDLSEASVGAAIGENIQVALNDSRVLLHVENVRKNLRFIPLKKGAEVQFTANHPLLTLVEDGNQYKVFHGNRRLTHLVPEYFDYDLSIDSVGMDVDGHEMQVRFGEKVHVKKRFAVHAVDGGRVNVIGFKSTKTPDESGISISRNDIGRRFSMDRSGNIFRVEVYRDDKFSGMVLVDFGVKKETRGLGAEEEMALVAEN